MANKLTYRTPHSPSHILPLEDAQTTARHEKHLAFLNVSMGVLISERNNHEVRSYKIQGVSVECQIFKNVKEKCNKYMLSQKCKRQMMAV